MGSIIKKLADKFLNNKVEKLTGTKTEVKKEQEYEYIIVGIEVMRAKVRK
jgi:hypothetical protein